MEFEVEVSEKHKGKKVEKEQRAKIVYIIGRSNYYIYPDNEGDRFDLFREVVRKKESGELYKDEEEIAYSLTMERLLLRLVEIAVVKKLKDKVNKTMTLAEYLTSYNSTVDELLKEINKHLGVSKILNINK